MNGAGPQGGAAAWQAARHILAVRLDNLGDVLMTTPAISALAGSDPSRRVTLLASRSGALVAGHVPALHDVMVYDAPWVKGPACSAHADRRFMEQLAGRRFDAAVIFTVSTQSALPAATLCRMAGIPLRLAYSRENPYALLTDWLRDDEVCTVGMRHEVQRQLALVRSVGTGAAFDDGLVFRCLPADVKGARDRLAHAGGNPSAPYVVVHPGCSAASRRYPAERFGLAAARIAAASGIQIVFVGGPDEQDEVSAARAAMQAQGTAESGIALDGRLSIGELGALIAGARLVVCNNSGPAHLAAAARTPVVVLYALTNPQHTPWEVPSRVLNRDVPCRNCQKSVCPQVHHGCLLGVEPEEVASAALELLRDTDPSVRPSPIAPAAAIA